MNHNIIFRLLVRDDINQLHDWLQLPHVRQFWDDGDRTVSQVESHYFNDEHTNEEVTIIHDYRWWSINDLLNTKEVIFPGCLARLVNDYISHSALWSAQEISLD